MSNSAIVGNAVGNVMISETYLTMNLNKIVNSSTGASGVFAAEYVQANAMYKFEFGINPSKIYSENIRDIKIIEEAMNKGITFNYQPGGRSASEPVISFNFTKYQGDLTDSQLNEITPRDILVGEEQIYVNTTSVTGSPTGNLVKAGDFIQLNDHAYQATQDVAYSSSSNITIPLNRKVMEANADISTFFIVNKLDGTGPQAHRSPRFIVKFAEQNPYTIQPHDRLVYKNASIKLVEVL